MGEPLPRPSEPETIDATCTICEGEGKGTYRTESRCVNCEWLGETVHSVGHEARDRDHRCPRCGCRTIYHGAYVVADGDREAMRNVPS